MLGTSIGLPLLEAMQGRPARAAGPTRRYFAAYVGTSLANDHDDRNGNNQLAPSTVGPRYDVKEATKPFVTPEWDVRPYISIVSGLRIPRGSAPAAVTTGFHCMTFGPQLAGCKSYSVSFDARMLAPSGDQLIVETIGAGSKARTFNVQVQPEPYADKQGGGRWRMSAYRTASGSITNIDNFVSPGAAFESLFGTFTPPTRGAATGPDPAQLYLQRTRASVLDLVQEQTRRLVARLGRYDRARMEQHLDEVRQLERQIASAGTAAPASAACRKPVVEEEGSDNDKRARLFCDLIHMAFTCDLVRSATMLLSWGQSMMPMKALIGVDMKLHDLTHQTRNGANTIVLSRALAWHLKHYAYLVHKLATTTEAGVPIIDNTAGVLVFEGGYNGSAHSTDNMIVLVAGKGGGRLAAGEHVVASGKHPGEVNLTALRALGYEGKFADLTQHLPELMA
jgi:hypothetical protein